MKTIYLFLILLLGSLFTSCSSNEEYDAEEIRKANEDVNIQDVQFQLNKATQKLEVTFNLKAVWNPIKKPVPVTIKILDNKLSETGIFVITTLNKEGKEITRESNYKESISVYLPKSISNKSPLSIDITVNKSEEPRVRYTYSGIGVSDWEDDPDIEL